MTTVKTHIRLSRADRKVIHGMAQQIAKGIAFTTDQHKLAVLLVTKYVRQLKRHQVDATLMNPNLLQLGTRELDKTSRVWYDPKTNELVCKFPYNTKLINEFYRIKRQGRFVWNKETKLWRVFPSEQNILQIAKWSEKNQIALSEEVCKRAEQLQAHPKFEISLQADGTITNCPPQLDAYVRKVTAGMQPTERLWWLADRSIYLGVNPKPAVSALCEGSAEMQEQLEPLLAGCFISCEAKGSFYQTLLTFCRETKRGLVLLDSIAFISEVLDFFQANGWPVSYNDTKKAAPGTVVVMKETNIPDIAKNLNKYDTVVATNNSSIHEWFSMPAGKPSLKVISISKNPTPFND